MNIFLFLTFSKTLSSGIFWQRVEWGLKNKFLQLISPSGRGILGGQTPLMENFLQFATDFKKKFEKIKNPLFKKFLTILLISIYLKKPCKKNLFEIKKQKNYSLKRKIYATHFHFFHIPFPLSNSALFF